ncbi:MarR family transcriptional regulator [Bacillus glycinifermentans]|uniref:HTH-type transcriptional regulator n=1 Tax=Bacillus glycinifermentans TaxID=1664069 RepID=A0A0J6EM88_9BACI|nr:GbsR/MarR family transcriptional regulator [Bacillus glycinifermentans]ATH93229.1 GbsR/MarR family transcriptional regulator [Bacillus glycinifermentans]KMM58395.1 MarR family transcriptional regulator [Bacillus glycinifermentans]KRT88395.1 MarR family transcriptional regulator [Bacillus glycinifermentans]MEC0483292.1 GbsR/MarR family transcriptional regulator [Bacillus glycinifermentans]MEC0493714.1 GbsR/MarR family transcriptional regulator [Bacillus glycinifermentans]
MEEKALQTVEQAKEHFIEKIAENMNTYGISSTVGRVLGIIYMNRKPLTLNELSDATGMSKTRMSQVVREMLDLNIAEKVFEKGVRKDLYDVEQDYYQTFISLFTANWSKVVKKNRMIGKKIRKELLDALEEDSLSPETEEKINDLLEETKKWLDYCQWLDNLIDFLESEDIFKYVPKP